MRNATNPGRRFLTVGLLTCLMFIPLFFAAEIVEGRKRHAETARDSVSREWGGAQTLSGPQLVIPVEETVTRVATRPRKDPQTGAILVDPQSGQDLMERFEEEVTQQGVPVFLYPDRFDMRIDTQSQIRKRGLFQVPVYQAKAQVDFDFSSEAAEATLDGNQRLLWEAAELRLSVSSNRALRGATTLHVDDRALALEPLSGRGGLRAATGDPRGLQRFTLDLGFNGAERLMLVPVGRDSRISLSSDWPHPSFHGAFLPDRSEIGEDGFEAEWRIPHLARALPQLSRTDPDSAARQNWTFGLSFIQPNAFYQKAWRAARYGLLFIALTFLSILLIEQGTGRRTHPVQYILIGLVQSLFVLLMVAYAEHLGFAAAYLLASGATVGLLTLFGALALKLGRRSWGLGLVLTLVYLVLYLILRSEDFALLAGSSLGFAALALTMFATRNEDWQGAPGGTRSGLWRRRAVSEGAGLSDPGAAVPAAPEETVPER